MSILLTYSNTIRPHGDQQRVSVSITSAAIEIAMRDDTDHTILDLTAKQAEELGRSLLRCAALADANSLMVQR